MHFKKYTAFARSQKSRSCCSRLHGLEFVGQGSLSRSAVEADGFKSNCLFTMFICFTATLKAVSSINTSA